ncbi:hypothetical protein QBC34DRAFT_479607 [Podospora aff. communis PSN243]|uniref:GPI anchored protein n=1 Tax=Podospora aff. communis PSN243 TaxID=3040156 RepID=A0AAV9G3T2_9PEZI|nr:hypothetical protein QBC34DRAFT_479607 [Podospora aff. communis PSN243]
MKTSAAFLIAFASGAIGLEEWVRTGNWSTLTCDNPGVVDETLSPEERWNLLDCDHAMDDILTAWREWDRYDGQSFSTAMFDQFHTISSPHCEDLSIWGSSCRVPRKCNTHAGSGPAGYIILNSIVATHLLFYNMGNTVWESLVDQSLPHHFGAEFGFMQDTTFKTSDEDINKLRPVLAETLTHAVLAAMAPSIKLSITQTLPRPNATLSKHLFTTTISLLTATLPSLNASTTSPDPYQNRLLHHLAPHSMLTPWSAFLSTATAALFNGSEPSISTLLRFIDKGAMLPPNLTSSRDTGSGYLIPETSENQAERKAGILRGLYGYAIPAAWMARRDGVFVLDSGRAGCEGTEEGIEDVLSKETAEKVGVCVEDKMYYLVSTGGRARGHFIIPKGVEGLDGRNESYYGGLGREQIVRGAVRTWEVNGRRNGAGRLDPYLQGEGAVERLWEEGVTMPGFVRLAVCGAEEANRNKGGGRRYGTWPCDVAGEDSAAGRVGGMGMGGLVAVVVGVLVVFW